MKRAISILLFFCFIIPSSDAQTLKAFLGAAADAMEEKDYYNAMYYYSQAVEFDTSAIDVIYKYGESAMTFNAYNVAESQFNYVTENDTENTYPLASYYLAEMQQRQGKYEDAKRNYELFLSENDGEYPRYINKAQKEIDAIEWAMENQDNPTEGVTIKHLDGSINTPYSDFGAVEQDEELYYSSLRFEENDDRFPSRLYSRILTQGEGDTTMTSVPDSDTETSSRKTKKSKTKDDDKLIDHEAHTSFSADGSRMYYTICQYQNSTDIRCDIYVKTKNDNGKFSKGKKLSSAINDASHTSTQPNIAFDQLSNTERLYFVSDREGGEGALDIWYSEVNGDEYSTPVNLSGVNTADNEVTPFYHSNSNTLYFSSDGYMGMGGYDIFSYALLADGEFPPSNLKAPTNTSFNDLYYTLNDEGTKAFFSSNRTGSLYLENSYEACCYDIYRADIEEIYVDMNAITFDGLTEEELLGARVRIYDAVTNELLYEKLNDLTNDHKFSLKCNRQYTIITDKPGFESDTTSLVTKDCDKAITKKIYLSPIEGKLDVLTFLAPNETALNGATVTLQDLSNPDNPPVVIAKPNGNLFQYDIIGGREYKIVAKRDGYEPKEITFQAIDFIEGVITKKIYFEKFIIALNEYLPVAVYFDNDHPDQRSRKLYTTKSYTDTYYPYVAKKEEFKKSYTKNMAGDLKANAESELEYFFETDVKGGFSRMRLFLDKLAERLDGGESIELSLKGFASPRAANKYNLALGQRRIWTIKNELKQYGGGKFLPFIDQGKLQVIEVSYGEETSPKNISDSYNNRRLSVYSVEASKQRKAEIVRVRVLN